MKIIINFNYCLNLAECEVDFFRKYVHWCQYIYIIEIYEGKTGLFVRNNHILNLECALMFNIVNMSPLENIHKCELLLELSRMGRWFFPQICPLMSVYIEIYEGQTRVNIVIRSKEKNILDLECALMFNSVNKSPLENIHKCALLLEFSRKRNIFCSRKYVH